MGSEALKGQRRWRLDGAGLRIWVYQPLCCCFFFLNYLLAYLFGCTGSKLKHVGSSIFIAACGLLVEVCEI